MIAMGSLALIGGILAGKNWGSRFFGVLVALAMLSLGWLTVGGITYVMVNLVADGIEAVSEAAYTPLGRSLLAKWLSFAGLALFYAKYVWEAYHTPISASGHRFVAGAAGGGRYQFK